MNLVQCLGDCELIGSKCTRDQLARSTDVGTFLRDKLELRAIAELKLT